MASPNPNDRPPQATVVVVSYETRDFLRRCLTSLQPDVDSGLATVIVVDNASSDGSAEMVQREFQTVRLIPSGGNIGFGPAVNLGGRHVSTPWLAASNADIELPPGALARLIASGTSHPDTAVVAPRLELLSGETQRSTFPFPRLTDRLGAQLGIHRVSSRAARRMEQGDDWAKEGGTVDWAMGAFLLFRTDAFQDVGGFDEEQWMYSEDMDVSWRLARSGWRTRYVPEATVVHVGEAAAGTAFSGRSDTLKLAAHYAWLEHRIGWAAMAADAALQFTGAAVRLVGLRVLRRVDPGRWTEAYEHVERWRKMNVAALRLRKSMRRPRSTRGGSPP